MKFTFLKRRKVQVAVGVAVLLFIMHAAASAWDARIMKEYNSLFSETTYDRTGKLVQVSLNSRDQICVFATTYPEKLSQLVLKKEDQWFYYHPGFHPYRMLGAVVMRVRGMPSGGASTVTQQLAKTLLNNTTQRNVPNKLAELALALILEYKHTKQEILTMYLNTVSLGGNIQGFPAAARAYYDKRLHELNENEVLQLVAALSNPSVARPLSEENLIRANMLAHVLGTASSIHAGEEVETVRSGVWLELKSLESGCGTCQSTLDVDLTERIRGILRDHLDASSVRGMTHGAVAVVEVKTGELLALVGSPNPNSGAAGMRINMALETRPIGSTIKPFIYLRAFELGLRPYTKVEDREYKFSIETGFPLYPKNYDGVYRGTVTLEEALANSLNVPTVQVLRYVTLSDFYEFLESVVAYAPPQSWDRYAYGIALGGLELDLLTLTHSFSALANNGKLIRLVVSRDKDGIPQYFVPPHSSLEEVQQIAEPQYVELLNSILTDRAAGVEQFGIKGSLNLSYDGYAVKTGTSRDYHDSWAVGYTGDYVVGVWAGNVENTPMRQVSGASGAGSVWHDVMELMYTTPYNHSTKLDMSLVTQVVNNRGYSHGLDGDDVTYIEELLSEKKLILFPHDGDVFLYTRGMYIPLSASEEVVWKINDVTQEHKDGWYPERAGTYTIRALSPERSEEVKVLVVEEQISLP